MTDVLSGTASGTASQIVEPAVTTGPIAGSSKAYREIEGPDGVTLRVPLRRVHLSTGDDFDLSPSHSYAWGPYCRGGW